MPCKTQEGQTVSASGHHRHRIREKKKPILVEHKGLSVFWWIRAPLLVKILSAQRCRWPSQFPWSHAVALQRSIKYSILRKLLSPETTKVKLLFSLEISMDAWILGYSKASLSCCEWPSRNNFSARHFSPKAIPFSSAYLWRAGRRFYLGGSLLQLKHITFFLPPFLLFCVCRDTGWSISAKDNVSSWYQMVENKWQFTKGETISGIRGLKWSLQLCVVMWKSLHSTLHPIHWMSIFHQKWKSYVFFGLWQMFGWVMFTL